MTTYAQIVVDLFHNEPDSLSTLEGHKIVLSPPGRAVDMPVTTRGHMRQQSLPGIHEIPPTQLISPSGEIGTWYDNLH